MRADRQANTGVVVNTPPIVIVTEGSDEDGQAVAAVAGAPAADLGGRGAEPAAGLPRDDGTPPGFDEAAESAFLAEARERGEVVAAPVAIDYAESTDARPLPRLEELVNRLSPEVRQMLDDLFRARFVTVKRIPKRALKV